MIQKSILIGALALAALSQPAWVHAQSAGASPAKKQLIERILKLQQPGIEATARGLIEQPALELMNSASNAIEARIPKDKQESIAREIEADARKYVDEATPPIVQRAVQLAPSTIGTLLESKFNEDELKQIVGIIESPVYGKFQALGDDMHKSLIEKIVAETRPQIEPKVRALEATMAKRLGLQPIGGGAPAPTNPAAPAARPATRPASR